MIKDADRGLKDRSGALPMSGRAPDLRNEARRRTKVPTSTASAGSTVRRACVLVANVSHDRRRPRPVPGRPPRRRGARGRRGRGRGGRSAWARTFARAAFGHAEKSPHVQMSKAHRIDVRLGRKVPYELDGGVRPKTDRLKITIEPGAMSIAVPQVALASV